MPECSSRVNTRDLHPQRVRDKLWRIDAVPTKPWPPHWALQVMFGGHETKWTAALLILYLNDCMHPFARRATTTILLWPSHGVFNDNRQHKTFRLQCWRNALFLWMPHNIHKVISISFAIWQCQAWASTATYMRTSQKIKMRKQRETRYQQPKSTNTRCTSFPPWLCHLQPQGTSPPPQTLRKQYRKAASNDNPLAIKFVSPNIDRARMTRQSPLSASLTEKQRRKALHHTPQKNCPPNIIPLIGTRK